MSAKTLSSGVCSLVLILLAGCGKQASQRAAVPVAIPVTLQYVEERGANGSLGDKPTFWVTNLTDKSLEITLQAIEVHTGAQWSVVTPAVGRLLFGRTADKPAQELGPHECDLGTLEGPPVTLPRSGRWRVRALVREKLGGFEKLKANLQLERRLLQTRLKTGNTNIPLNVLSGGPTRYGHGQMVLSTEIVIDATSRPVSRPSGGTGTAVPRGVTPEQRAKAFEALHKKWQELEAQGAPGQPAATNQ